jgi:hypothetical protein
MKWTSNSQWPDFVCLPSGTEFSVDIHSSRQAAEVACQWLAKHGLGGTGEVYPLRVWVEPATVEPAPFPQTVEEAFRLDFSFPVKCARCGWFGLEEDTLSIEVHEPRHGEGCGADPECPGLCPQCRCFPDYIGDSSLDYYEPFWREDCPF